MNIFKFSETVFKKVAINFAIPFRTTVARHSTREILNGTIQGIYSIKNGTMQGFWPISKWYYYKSVLCKNPCSFGSFELSTVKLMMATSLREVPPKCKTLKKMSFIVIFLSCLTFWMYEFYHVYLELQTRTRHIIEIK